MSDVFGGHVLCEVVCGVRSNVACGQTRGSSDFPLCRAPVHSIGLLVPRDVTFQHNDGKRNSKYNYICDHQHRYYSFVIMGPSSTVSVAGWLKQIANRLGDHLGRISCRTCSVAFVKNINQKYLTKPKKMRMVPPSPLARQLI
jgi:hypothetical protein